MNRFGTPYEWFNPDAIAGNNEYVGAANLLEYIDAVRREYKSKQGIFGAVASFYHLHSLLDELTIEQVFGGNPIWFYLRRRNLLRQGISLYMSTESGYWHSPQGEGEEYHRYQAVSYDASKIQYWTAHIVDHEIGFEELFREYGVEPVRICYESLTDDPKKSIRLFFNVLTLRSPSELSLNSTISKIGSVRNASWEERFLSDEADWLDELRRRRPEI